MHTVIANEPKMVIYWGQNSAGNIYPDDPSKWERPLRDYCSTGAYDIIVMGFAYMFPFASNPASDYPGLNFANHCNTTYNDENPFLLICPEIAADVVYCQSQGIQILLSFGGGVGLYGFSSDDQATTFATLVWNMFLGGTGTIRPFGSAILDGVDLDIEGGYITGYVAFISQLRSYFATASKTYYISSAPQCPFPDGRLGPGTGTALQSAWFDYVWVQFYNNYCGLNAYPGQFNFDSWATWASSTSLNPNVKVFIGAPASSDAAGSGFVESATLELIASVIAANYASSYGGIMLWDASSSDLNNDFALVVADIVHGESIIPVILSSTTGSKPTPSPPVASTTTGAKITPPTPVSSTTTGKKTSTSTSTPTTTTTGAKTSTSTTGTKASTSTSTSTTGHAQSTTTGHAAIPVTPVSTSTSTSTGSSAASSGSQACTLGWEICVGASEYQTCTNGRNGNFWATPQSCQAGLVCSPSGNFVYCVR